MALKECIRARTMASAPGAALTVHVRENGLFEPFLHQKRTFYSDRLGTNIGKALKKQTVFLGSVPAFEADVAAQGCFRSRLQ